MFKAAFLVSGHDPHGRPLGRLIHARPVWLGEDVRNGMAADPWDGTTRIEVCGDLAVTAQTFRLPAVEDHPWETGTYGEIPGRETAPEPPALPALAVGDVVATDECRGYPGAPGDGRDVSVILSGVSVIGHAHDASVAADIIAARFAAQDPPGPRLDWLTDGETLDFEAGSVLAEQEPDEALFAVWQDGSGTLQSHVLASTGSWFYHADGSDAHDYGFDPGRLPGIFLLSNGQPRTWNGDDDGSPGISGDIVPASAHHLGKMGVDADFIRGEMAVLMQDVLAPVEDPFAALAAQGAELPEWANFLPSAPAIAAG